MAKTAKRKAAPKFTRKQARMEAFQKLSIAFGDYKAGDSDKKWNKKLKKASKVLAQIVVPAKPGTQPA